jgi:hypothetical protein
MQSSFCYVTWLLALRVRAPQAAVQQAPEL